MKNYHQLFILARKNMVNAHAPYSKFKVGAAIFADNDEFYGGCNVENISYPCGTCAEAGAIAAMVAGGGKKIRQILITSEGTFLITPCGACLQRICEFADADTEILLADAIGVQKTFHISDLMPNAFKEF